MMKQTQRDTAPESAVQDLAQALLALESKEEMMSFLKDLCTPQEITALAERWRVAQILHEGDLSYREIHDQTGASLGTIVRVARFLKDEQNQGYTTAITKITKKRSQS